MASPEWFVRIGDREIGPLSPAQLLEMAQKAEMGAQDLVRKGETGKWVRASQVKGVVFQSSPKNQTAHASPTAPLAAALVTSQSPPPVALPISGRHVGTSIPPLAIPIPQSPEPRSTVHSESAASSSPQLPARLAAHLIKSADLLRLGKSNAASLIVLLVTLLLGLALGKLSCTEEKRQPEERKVGQSENVDSPKRQNFVTKQQGSLPEGDRADIDLSKFLLQPGRLTGIGITDYGQYSIQLENADGIPVYFSPGQVQPIVGDRYQFVIDKKTLRLREVNFLSHAPFSPAVVTSKDVDAASRLLQEQVDVEAYAWLQTKMAVNSQYLQMKGELVTSPKFPAGPLSRSPSVIDAIRTAKEARNPNADHSRFHVVTGKLLKLEVYDDDYYYLRMEDGYNPVARIPEGERQPLVGFHYQFVIDKKALRLLSFDLVPSPPSPVVAYYNAVVARLALPADSRSTEEPKVPAKPDVPINYDPPGGKRPEPPLDLSPLFR